MDNKMARFTDMTKKQDEVTEGSVTFQQREDGMWALPGEYYTTNKAYARQIAKRLNFEINGAKSPIAKLAEKHVTRIKGLCSETSVMGA